ncbi:hypothetical protein OkiPb01551_28670 [Bordetella pertussis]|nr:hypothetical protein BPJ_00470 [Bordetella pertussis]BDC26135.1 hypothetical protein NB2BOR_A04260 [Bordetella parapertussis]BDT06343.1 hypothetical protein BP3J_00470 [Bordetella pertussis]
MWQKGKKRPKNQADMVTKWAFPCPAVIQFWPRTGAFGKYACAEGKRETGRPCPACAAPATVPMARDAPWQPDTGRFDSEDAPPAAMLIFVNDVRGRASH